MIAACSGPRAAHAHASPATVRGFSLLVLALPLTQRCGMW